MSYHDQRDIPTTRVISRGDLGMHAYVTHRDTTTVNYHFGDQESMWSLTPEQFDKRYRPILPGDRGAGR